jgi:hypothetical protein
MTVELYITAELFIDDLVPHFTGETGDYIPEYVYIYAQIITTDTRGQIYEDWITIEIKGSGQDKSSVCDWTLLSLSDFIADSWEYQIGEDTLVRKEILVTTELGGIDQLSPECAEQVSMSLEVKLADDVWMEIWSSVSTYEYDAIEDHSDYDPSQYDQSQYTSDANIDEGYPYSDMNADGTYDNTLEDIANTAIDYSTAITDYD